MSTVLRTLHSTSVVLLVAALGFATASAAFADESTGDNGKSDELHQTKENGSAQNDESKGDASSHQTTAQNGEYTEPQPISSADDNGTGANQTDGPYRSNRHGAESLNGNGNGEATGKPCAGCVGRADNKEPQGQMPDAVSDGNNGYECDGNNGIAKTNPAHTGCSPEDTVVPETPPTTEVQGENESKGGTEVLGEHIVREVPEVLAVEAVPAASPAPSAVEVLGLHEIRSTEVAAAAAPAAPAAQAQPAGSSLPLTGANIVTLMVIAALIAGAGMLARSASHKSELL